MKLRLWLLAHALSFALLPVPAYGWRWRFYLWVTERMGAAADWG